MSDERRYREDEVEEIFDLATGQGELERSSRSDSGGLTLSELQEVGREVGMDPDTIAQAALAVDSKKSALPRGSSLGMPVSVGRIVPLPRAMTNKEWGKLTVELRDTFGARGKITSEGGMRTWSNGNLRARLEVTETGHQLRLETTKGNARLLNLVGVGGTLTGLVLIPLMLLIGVSPVRNELFALQALGVGIGSLVANRVRLPRWASEREGQMEYIASQVPSFFDELPEDEDGES